MWNYAMQVFLTAFVISCVMGCASTSPYPKIRTAEEAIDTYKDGVARTPNGNLVDIKFEEVVSQRDALKTKLDRAMDDISYRDGRIQQLEATVMELRVHMGLPARRPAAKTEIGKDGYINKATYVPAPSLDEEFANLR